MLAILGGRDRLYPSAPTAARYRAAGARVVVIDDAGHSVNVQRPAEVAELIRESCRAAHARLMHVSPWSPVSQRSTHGPSRDST